MKHKSTKYKTDETPKTFVVEFKPVELAALYTVLGHVQSNHLEDSLAGINSDTLFNLVAELGNIGNIDFDDGWRDLVRSKTSKWIPVEKASEFVTEDIQP